jgi:hypothetical protein
MTYSDCEKRLSRNEEKRLEKALARLIGSTRRPHRAKNLLEVAKEIKVAEKLLGSRKAVARRIGLSDEMLKEFESVNELEEPVKRMVKDGLITSVDTAYRISLLPKSDQLAVARAYIEHEISGKDVKEEIIALRRKNSKQPIQKIINSLKGSRPRVQYVIRFPVYSESEQNSLQRKFESLINKKNLVSFEVRSKIGTITVTEEGKIRLESEARRRKITKKKIVQLMLEDVG